MNELRTMPLGGDITTDSPGDGAAAMTLIGRSLARAFSDVVESPLPPRLQALVDRLDSAEHGSRDPGSRHGVA